MARSRSRGEPLDSRVAEFKLVPLFKELTVHLVVQAPQGSVPRQPILDGVSGVRAQAFTQLGIFEQDP